MSGPASGLAHLELPGSGALADTLKQLPALPGVARLAGAEDRTLLIARPADLRRWARAQLGLGPRRSARPALDLSGVARALHFAATRCGFEQRRAWEGLMREVPRRERRDLPHPVWLRLDADARFPRLEPCEAPGSGSYGPFAGRARAVRARDRLNRRFELRPCEVDFEPAPDLPLGLGCLFAQLRTCAAPCLERIEPAGYRELAQQAARFLAEPAARPAECDEWLPASVAAHDARSAVVERVGSGFLAWPVRCGRVGEPEQAEQLGAALAALRWPDSGDEPSDAAWLLDWLSGPRRSGAYRVLASDAPSPAALADELLRALPAAPKPRGNVARRRSQ